MPNCDAIRYAIQIYFDINFYLCEGILRGEEEVRDVILKSKSIELDLCSDESSCWID